MFYTSTMKYSSRRTFLKNSAALAGLAVAGSAFNFKKGKPLLSFSTLGCPDWPFSKIVDFAVLHQYDGLEIRGILRELDLTKCQEFGNNENITATKKLMQSKGLKFVDLGSSATMHFPEGTERQKNLDEGKKFIDLAANIDCPYIRVFPNNFPKDRDHNATIDLIVKGLLELGEYAKGTNVTVLMETHGELVYVEDLLKIMQAAEHKHTGLVWDAVNMWSVTKEPPSIAYEKLKKYIRHTHIKDLKKIDDKDKYVLLGKGDTPVMDAVDLLYKDGYKGYYSFEWEKLWHPEIDDPEIAIADYVIAMHEHFKI